MPSESEKYDWFLGILDDIANQFGLEKLSDSTLVVEELMCEKQLIQLTQFRRILVEEGQQNEFPLGGLGTTLNAAVMYCLARSFGFKSCLETGVSGGFYSAFLLKAMEKNEGFVESVELSDDMTLVGKIVPENLKVRWRLNTGTDSVKWLKENEMDYDFFVHDSLHTMAHMLKELTEFKRCEKDKFLVYIDDQHAQNFWNNCLRLNAFEKKGYNVTIAEESVGKGHIGGFLLYEKA